MSSNVIDDLYIWQFSIPDTGHKCIPFLVNAANKVNEQSRMLQVSMCKKEEAVNDEEGKRPVAVAARGTA